MHVLRFPALQRVVALLLFAGVGATCVPVADAASPETTALEDELRSVLGDAEAVELAIQAARRATTPDAAVAAFVQAYTEATGDAAAAQDIARLLDDHPNRFGAPAIPLSQTVWTAASSTAHLLYRSVDAAFALHTPADEHGTLGALAPTDEPVPSGVRALRTQQARAP